MRGQLAQALYEATKNSAEYLFGDWVTKIDEQSDCVRVGFNNDTPSREFDLVIVADGQNSSTRDLAFDGKLPGELKSLDQWIVWFGISDLKHDDRSWRWYNAPGGRMVSMRPSDTDTRGNLAIIGHGDEMKSVLALCLQYLVKGSSIPTIQPGSLNHTSQAMRTEDLEKIWARVSQLIPSMLPFGEWCLVCKGRGEPRMIGYP